MKRELPAGHVVRFTHYRFVDHDVEVGVVPDKVVRASGLTRTPMGGMTEAHVFNGKPEEGNLVGEGVAYCSDLDNYDRRIGRTISLGRALKHMEQQANIEDLVAEGMSREDAEALVLGEPDEPA